MKTLASLLVLALQDAAPTKAVAVSFETAPLAKGAKVALTSAIDVTIDVTVKIQDEPERKESALLTQNFAATAAVAAAGERGPTEVALEFGKCTERRKNSEEDRDEETAFSGKTYAAKGDRSKFAVTVPDELDVDERTITKALLKPIFGGAPLATTLAGKSFEKGAVIDVAIDDGAAALGPLLGALGKQLHVSDPIRSIKLTLDGTRKEGETDAAVFRAEVVVEKKGSDGDPATMNLTLAGEIVVAKRGCHLLAAALKGSAVLGMDHDASDLPIELSGTGVFTWTYSAKLQ